MYAVSRSSPRRRVSDRAAVNELSPRRRVSDRAAVNELNRLPGSDEAFDFDTLPDQLPGHDAFMERLATSRETPHEEPAAALDCRTNASEAGSLALAHADRVEIVFGPRIVDSRAYSQGAQVPTADVVNISFGPRLLKNGAATLATMQVAATNTQGASQASPVPAPRLGLNEVNRLEVPRVHFGRRQVSGGSQGRASDVFDFEDLPDQLPGHDEFIQRLGTPRETLPEEANTYTIGEDVEVRDFASSKWLPGIVSALSPLMVKTADAVRGVSWRFVRKTGEACRKSPAADSNGKEFPPASQQLKASLPVNGSAPLATQQVTATSLPVEICFGPRLIDNGAATLATQQVTATSLPVEICFGPRLIDNGAASLATQQVAATSLPVEICFGPRLIDNGAATLATQQVTATSLPVEIWFGPRLIDNGAAPLATQQVTATCLQKSSKESQAPAPHLAFNDLNRPEDPRVHAGREQPSGDSQNRTSDDILFDFDDLPDRLAGQDAFMERLTTPRETPREDLRENAQILASSCLEGLESKVAHPKSLFDEPALRSFMYLREARPLQNMRKIWGHMLANPNCPLDEVPGIPASIRGPLRKAFQFTASSIEKVVGSSIWIRLHDGDQIEAVVDSESERLFVSSQTNRRNLSSGEIQEQLLHARTKCSVTNVSFMGMGEPLENYECVVQAIHGFVDKDRFALEPHNITVSTVGIVGNLRRLVRDAPKINLTVAMHAPSQELREKLVPIAKIFKLGSLMDTIDEYARNCTGNVTLSYTLLAGVNDSDACASQLHDLVRRRAVSVEIIPHTAGTQWESWARLQGPSPPSCENGELVASTAPNIGEVELPEGIEALWDERYNQWKYYDEDGAMYWDVKDIPGIELQSIRTGFDAKAALISELHALKSSALQKRASVVGVGSDEIDDAVDDDDPKAALIALIVAKSQLGAQAADKAPPVTLVSERQPGKLDLQLLANKQQLSYEAADKAALATPASERKPGKLDLQRIANKLQLSYEAAGKAALATPASERKPGKLDLQLIANKLQLSYEAADKAARVTPASERKPGKLDLQLIANKLQLSYEAASPVNTTSTQGTSQIPRLAVNEFDSPQVVRLHSARAQGRTAEIFDFDDLPDQLPGRDDFLDRLTPTTTPLREQLATPRETPRAGLPENVQPLASFILTGLGTKAGHPKSLFDEPALRSFLSQHDAQPLHSMRKIWGHMLANPSCPLDEIPGIPANIRGPLRKEFQYTTSNIEKVVGCRFWFRLHDGDQIEAVVDSESGQLFVSSQSNHRNLSSGEIQEQLVHTRAKYSVTRVSFMSMGEPLENYECVLQAIRGFVDKGRFALEPGSITVSTVGIVGNMRRLVRDAPQVNLTVVMQAPDQELREKLNPMAKIFKLGSLLDAVDEYARNCTGHVKLSYKLLVGVNDSDACASQLGDLVKGRSAGVEVVPYKAGTEWEAWAQLQRPSLPWMMKPAGFEISDLKASTYTLGECVEVRDTNTADWKQRVVTRVNPLLIGGLEWNYVRKIDEANSSSTPNVCTKGPPAESIGKLVPPAASVFLNRAQSVGIAPSTQPPLPVSLRRFCSEPTSAEGAGPRFTDKLLQLLTRETTTTTPEQLPAVSIDFGQDPPLRPNAGKCSAMCTICLETKSDTVQLCWNSDCQSRFCTDCVRQFAEEAVERAIYAVPWLHCPGCSGRISTNSWSKCASRAFETYRSNAEALLNFRCGECHEVGNLLVGNCTGSDITSLGQATSKALTAAWPDFAYAIATPDSIIDVLGDSEEDLKLVLQCVEDLERRTCLHLAWLRQNPFIKTECCDGEFCFKCKVGTHHEGETCEERQRAELDIFCQFCPECEVPTVRTEGCDHIVCVCGHEWTWQEYVEVGWALGPLANLREVLGNGSLDPTWTNQDDGTETSLLMSTAGAGLYDHTKLLLEHGADVQARQSDGYSALLCAFGAATGTYTSTVVDLLLESKAEVWKADPFVWVSSQGASHRFACDIFTHLLKLTDVGVNDMWPNRTPEEGFLRIALRNGRKSIVTQVLEQGVEIPRTSPFWFVRGPIRDTAVFDKIMLGSGASIDIADLDGKTLLKICLEIESTELTQHLVTKHSARSSFREMAREAGVFWSETHIILPLKVFDALIEQGCGLWEEDPAGGGDASRGWLLQRVVRCWSYCNTRTAWRQTPIRTNLQGLQERILNRWNGDADKFAKTKDGAVVLTLAAHFHQWNVVDRLIRAGAPLDVPSSEYGCDGRTPLFIATAGKNGFILARLLQSRADILAARDSGIIEAARKANWPDGVSILEAAVEEQKKREEKRFSLKPSVGAWLQLSPRLLNATNVKGEISPSKATAKAEELWPKVEATAKAEELRPEVEVSAKAQKASTEPEESSCRAESTSARAVATNAQPDEASRKPPVNPYDCQQSMNAPPAEGVVDQVSKNRSCLAGIIEMICPSSLQKKKN